MKQINFKTNSPAPTAQRVVLQTAEDIAISFDAAVSCVATGYAPIGQTVALSAGEALPVTAPVDGAFNVIYPSGIAVPYQIEICDESITTHSEGGGDVPSDSGAFKPFSHYVSISKMPDHGNVFIDDDTMYSIDFEDESPVTFVVSDISDPTPKRFGILTWPDNAVWTIAADAYTTTEQRILPYADPTAGQHMYVWQNLGVYDEIAWWGCQTY